MGRKSEHRPNVVARRGRRDRKVRPHIFPSVWLPFKLRLGAVDHIRERAVAANVTRRPIVVPIGPVAMVTSSHSW
jgi:hypothetical protein